MTDYVSNLVEQAISPVYTVSYKEESDGAATDTISTVAGTYIIAKAAPAKSGYIFRGWSDGTTTHAPGDKVPVTSDLTLTAQWEKE